jgi:flavin-dependent dehydrogenase
VPNAKCQVPNAKSQMVTAPSPLAEARFDLAVIGGGPAGAAAAIMAARAGARVVLFEAKTFPRHKVCGEFVSSESLEVLDELIGSGAAGLLDQTRKLERTRLFFRKRMIEAPVEPAGVSITRYCLDFFLWCAAEAVGVTTFLNTEVTAIHGSGPFEVAAGSAKYYSRTLVIAAGRWSQFTPDRVLPPGPKWIGVKCHFREENPPPSTDLYFFNHGYCGVQPIAPDTVNACAMVRSDCATSLEEVFAQHRGLSERAALWEPVIAPVSTAPLIYREPQPIKGNVLFVGDAAAFIDPFVGDGISIALRSGRLAAEGLRLFFCGQLTLGECAALYKEDYMRNFAPLLAAASRVRSLMSLPPAAQVLAFEALRLPGLIPFVIRKTRRAS